MLRVVGERDSFKVTSLKVVTCHCLTMLELMMTSHPINEVNTYVTTMVSTPYPTRGKDLLRWSPGTRGAERFRQILMDEINF